MAYNKIKIINLALIEIGKKPVNETQDAGDLGVAAELQYDLLLDSILSNYSWRFATTQVQLSRLTQVPLKRWQYAYQLPANYLTAISVIPYSQYEIFESYVYSNHLDLFMVYRFKPNEPNLPVYFINYFKLELALSLARFATVEPAIIAEIKASLKIAKFEATSTDAMARPNRLIQNSRLINVRYNGRTITSF